MVYYGAETNVIEEKEPFSSFLSFIRKTDSFLSGKEWEFHIFENEDGKFCFKHGFRNGVDHSDGVLCFYVQGPDQHGSIYIRVTYTSEFDMQDAQSLIGGWSAHNMRFPFFYLQNTIARSGSIQVLESDDPDRGRACFKLEAVTSDESYIEGVGMGMISYLIGSLANEE